MLLMNDGRSIPLRNLSRALGGKIDDVYFSDNPNVFTIFGKLNKTVLVLADFMSCVYYYNYKISGKPKFFFKWIVYEIIERVLYRRLKKVIIQTNFEIKHSQRIGLNNTFKLTNYVKRSERLRKPRRKSDIIKVGIIATFDNIYSIQTATLIKLLHQSESSKIELLLAGKGSDKFEGQHGVTVLGVVADLSDFYDAIDVAACISWKGYGFINKLAESISRRCPVVCNLSALNEMEFLKDSPAVMLVNSDLDVLDYDSLTKFIDRNKDLKFLNSANEKIQCNLGLSTYFKNVRDLANELSTTN